MRSLPFKGGILVRNADHCLSTVLHEKRVMAKAPWNHCALRSVDMLLVNCCTASWIFVPTRATSRMNTRSEAKSTHSAQGVLTCSLRVGGIEFEG